MTQATDPVVLGRYADLREVTGGATSRVWRATDTRTGSEVAIKVLHQGQPSREEITALLLARLPGIARLVDEGAWRDHRVLVTGWVEGRPFPGEARSGEELRQVTARLLEALAGLHGLGMVHRDLKPANVLVEHDGRVVLVDLGLVREAATAGGGSGTEAYVAPEQLFGVVDRRSDVYAVGAMVQEALTGRPPCETLEDKLLGRVAPLPSDTPADLRTLVERALSLDPGGRPDADGARSLLAVGREPLPPLRGAERVFRCRATARRRLRGRDEEEVRRGWRREGIERADGVLVPGRLAALEARDLARSEPEALWAHAARAADRGRATLAAALIGAAVRAGHRPAGWPRAWAEAAVAAFALDGLEEASAGVRRWGDDPATERTLQAAILVSRGEHGRAAAALGEPADALGFAVACRAARWASEEAHDRLTAGFRPGPGEEAVASNARGLFLYRAGRFAEAAALHERAAGQASTPGRRAMARTNAAAALLEVPDPEGALAAARAVVVEGVGEGLVEPTARAWCLLRAAKYRAGRARRPDLGWVETLRLAEDPGLGHACLTEGAVAFRAGDRGLAGTLAAEGARAFTAAGQPAAAWLAGCLGAACGGPAPGVSPGAPAGVEAQGFALLGDWRRAAAAARRVVGDPGVRREILSMNEAQGGGW